MEITFDEKVIKIVIISLLQIASCGLIGLNIHTIGYVRLITNRTEYLKF